MTNRGRNCLKWPPNHGEMRQMNLPLSKPEISPSSSAPSSWSISRAADPGRSSQQHRDKTSSFSAHSAGSERVNPGLDEDSLHRLSGALFLTSSSAEEVTPRQNKRAVSAGGLWQAAVSASCPTCSAACHRLGRKVPAEGQIQEEVGGTNSPTFPPKPVLSPELVTRTFVAVTHS